jgi:hypothetical protein
MPFESGQTSEHPQSADGFPLPEPEGARVVLAAERPDEQIPVVCPFPAGVRELEIVQFLRKTAHGVQRTRSVQSRGSRARRRAELPRRETNHMVTLLSRLPAPTSPRISKGAGEPHMLGLGVKPPVEIS